MLTFGACSIAFMRKPVYVLVFLSLLPTWLFAQSFVPGTSYFSNNDHVEYIAGNLPLIIGVPHGGGLEPNNIPDRNCSGCVYGRDAFTQELSREIMAAIHAETGCYPHVIINKLHRKKLDANRAIGEAADGNALGEEAWHAFHAFIDSAEEQVMADFGKGIFFDLHGHGHDIQRLELGYLFSRSELQMSDNQFDAITFINESSIKNLVNTNVNGLSHSELLRGGQSFGEILEDKNYRSVPSQQDPHPFNGEAYFSGGYNTNRYGSHKGGTIDAIQIECNQDVRFETAARQRFADSLALSMLEFLETHYFPTLSTSVCNAVSIEEEIPLHFEMFPNPSQDFVMLETDAYPLNLRLLNPLGQEVKAFPISYSLTRMDITELTCGAYYMEMLKDGQILHRAKLLKACQ